MPNLIPQDIREWMRRMEFKTNDLTRRMSNLIPGDIADGVDLDGFKSSGRWRRKSNTGTTTGLHYPFAGAAGVLEVYWLPDDVSVQVQQIWYDRSGSMWLRWWNGATWSAWLSSSDSGLPNIASTTVVANQTIVSGTLAVLPTTVTATVSIPPGTHIVMASITALMGSGTGAATAASASLKYHLSGALSFAPTLNTAGIGGTDAPIASGGGTLTRNHEVTVASATNLTITAMGVLHFGVGVVVRDVTVQLTVLRRN